ncbi:MAG: hypothetical protein AAB417_00955 [Patescibacteria group bacterium]
MDKIEKFLRKLSQKEREVVNHIIEKVLSNDTRDLDVKKLKDEYKLFRVRKGNIRIVFFQDDSVTRIVYIRRRGEKTYNL